MMSIAFHTVGRAQKPDRAEATSGMSGAYREPTSTLVGRTALIACGERTSVGAYNAARACAAFTF